MTRKQLLTILTVLFILIIVIILGWRLYRGSLIIEAQIIYNMGGPQPVARQTFYLLDVDPFTLKADDTKYKSKYDALKTEDEKLRLSTSAIMLVMLKKAVEEKNLVKNSEKQFLGTLEMSKPFWEPHLVKLTQTDFKGTGVFENLKPGDYWLIGMAETRAGFAFWNLKVKVGLGENKLSLDQNNSLYSK